MSDFPPVLRDELDFAIGAMNAAATLKTPVENPESRRLNIYDEESGEVMEIRFRDTPLNRALVALTEHFEPQKARNIGMRWFALVQIANRPQLREWIRETPDGGAEISEALLVAAARATILRGKFKVNELVRLAREGA